VNSALALVGTFLAGTSGLLAALVGKRRPQLSTAVAVGAMLTGALCGITAAIRCALGCGDVALNLPWAVPGGAFAVYLDPIACVFLLQIFLLGALGAVYGIGYWSFANHPESTGRLRSFYGLMVAGMALLVLADNSILFLVGWEVMALAAYLALTADDRSAETRESGFVYLVATRCGTLALIAMFALLHTATSSFAWPRGGLASDSPLASAIFCFGVLGFGLKAGVMPLHLWLPGAHANAPTHVSAVMSGVLIKMGVYGLVRLGAFCEHPPLFWGVVLFGLGTVSAVLGVAFAIGQHDLKRLLAYHSVENVGIIVMSLGVAVIGRSSSRTDLVGLGLAGALLHTFNHGLFKSLLFFCAGSVISATKTRKLDLMGGLARKLPVTAVCFLVGAAAICGLPPLNGFISELFLYVGMLRGGVYGHGSLGALLVFGVPALALVGALAVACFAKVHGVVFLGEPRSASCASAKESPLSMRLPMVVLSLACITIGTMPLVATGILDRAISAWHTAANGVPLSDLAPVKLLMWSNLGLVAAIVVMAWIAKSRISTAQIARGPTWDCGYVAASARMQYTASSFAEWIVLLFSRVLRPRTKSPTLTTPFPGKANFESHVPEVVLDLAVLPTLRGLVRTANWFRWIQPGSIHLYIVYVLIALVVMFSVWH
jgi:hydrogenase-4 component B